MSGRRVLRFSHPPAVLCWASVVGKKEGEGPLAGSFDVVNPDTTFGEKTWEKAESRMQQIALQTALHKGGLRREDIDCLFAGDLLNQCIGSGFAHRDSGIPFLGLYGACSTMAEGLLCAAAAVDGGYAGRAAVTVSSHFCSAERQYRFPLAYGGQRTPTAQWTVTGAGCAVLGAGGGRRGVHITAACPGRIVDLGVTDVNNMGGAMAPAAFDTLWTFFEQTDTAPADYDLIVTGDLAQVGADVLRRLFADRGVDLAPVYHDCGLMIFDRDKQDVHAGGSGCGCSAAVLCGEILRQMEQGKRQKVIFAGTGALLSPTSMQQGESIPGICHLVLLEG